MGEEERTADLIGITSRTVKLSDEIDASRDRHPAIRKSKESIEQAPVIPTASETPLNKLRSVKPL